MEECYICFTTIEKPSDFSVLSCSHKLCKFCYLRLDKPNCPLCRQQFTYTKDEIYERKQLGIIDKYNKYNSPSAQRSRINDLSLFTDIERINHRPNSNNNQNHDNDINHNQYLSGIIARQTNRKRRRNLSEEEIKEKRSIVREICRNKWIRKNGRLAKMQNSEFSF